MRRRDRSLIPYMLTAAAVVLSLPAEVRPAPPESAPAPPAAPARERSVINIFIEKPANLEDFWKKLGTPDFILLKGEGLYRQIGRAPADLPPAGSPPAVVESVEVRGEVADDLASLEISFGVALEHEGPDWVPLRLDDQVLIDLGEEDRELPRRYIAGKGWEVELRGAGRHRVRARLKTRLKATAEGWRLECAIPEAGQTDLDLDVPQRVAEARSGPNEPIEHRPASSNTQRTRLSARLTPRSRLVVSWQVDAAPGVQLPPLLSIQGEIAVDLEPGSLRTRSSWLVHAVRGAAKVLEFRLDPEDEVLELELDGQAPPASIERSDGGSKAKMAINLTEPLQPGAPKRLIMTTRRAIATPSPTLVFNGFALLNAREQSGAVGIVKGDNLWVDATSGGGLHRIDPRDLPAELRARPATFLAYQFIDQPFGLTLRVEPAPPLLRAEARTTVTLSARQARVETALDYQTARGRLFDVKVALPRGLELESVGPEDLVESSKLVHESPSGAAAPEDGPRVLTVLLKPRARELGAFSVRSVGRQAIDPSRPVRVALFQPRQTVAGGGRIAVLTERDVTVGLPDSPDVGGEAAGFRAGRPPVPADWPWPADGPPPAGSPALWLRYDDDPAALPLQVAVHPRTVAQEVTLLARMGRREVEFEQKTECTVHFGALDRLDLVVPAEYQGHWTLEEGDVAGREDLGPGAGGQVVRLRFAEAVTDKVSLKFRVRLPRAPRPGAPTEVPVRWIRVRDGSLGPVRVRVASEAGVAVEGGGPGWSREAEPEPDEAGPPVRFALTSADPGPPPLVLSATAQALAALPPLVASRLWIRTVLGPAHGLHTTALYRVEAHQGSLPVALPPGADWVQVRVGGDPIRQIETLAQRAGYRLPFPARWKSGPVLVELEYTTPARMGVPPWQPPRLLDGGLVQATLWEVRLPWSRAAVGVPAGWTDENEWYWDQYVWKRRPWKDAAALAAWVGGPSGRAPGAEVPPDDGASDYHAYLFGRPGSPQELPLCVASRAWLVALCSGAVLGVGSFLLLVWSPPLRLLALVLAALGVAAAVAFHPSVALLAVQSAMVGVILTSLAAVMHWLVENRRAVRPVFGEPSGLSSATRTPGSTVSRPMTVGSDDSTAIRVRAASSTVDYIVAAPAPPVEGGSGRGAPADPDRE